MPGLATLCLNIDVFLTVWTIKGWHIST